MRLKVIINHGNRTCALCNQKVPRGQQVINIKGWNLTESYHPFCLSGYAEAVGKENERQERLAKSGATQPCS